MRKENTTPFEIEANTNRNQKKKKRHGGVMTRRGKIKNNLIVNFPKFCEKITQIAPPSPFLSETLHGRFIPLENLINIRIVSKDFPSSVSKQEVNSLNSRFFQRSQNGCDEKSIAYSKWM